MAELAHLKLTPEETGAMQHDLNAILAYVAELNELDTTGVQPLAQVTELLDVERRCAARRCGCAFAGSCAGDGRGAGHEWGFLQGAKGD